MGTKVNASAQEECLDLRFDNVELEHPYFYKELCEVLGAKYYGTCTRSVEKQLSEWSKCMVLERSGRKITVKKIFPSVKWIANPSVAFMNGLRSDSYNRQIFEILIYKLWKAPKVVKRGEDGRVENWRKISCSNYQWKIMFGLFSSQLQRYGKKLYKLAVAQIMSYRLTTIVNQIYYRAINKFQTDGNGLVLGKVGKFAYIDTTDPIDKDDDAVVDLGTAVKWNEKYYKIKTAFMNDDTTGFVAAVKQSILKLLGCTSSTEAYDKGLDSKYSQSFYDAVKKIYYDKRNNKFVFDNSDGEEASKNKAGLIYKVINFWDALTIEMKDEDVLAVMGMLKRNILDEEWPDKYFTKLAQNINDKVLTNVYNQIDKGELVPRVGPFKELKSLDEKEICLQAALLAKYNKGVFGSAARGLVWKKDGGVKSGLTKDLCRNVLKELVTVFGKNDQINRMKAGTVDLSLKNHYSVERMKNIALVDDFFSDSIIKQ